MERNISFVDMVTEIEIYHTKLGQRRAFDTDEQRMQSVRNLSLAAMMELAELVDSLPWKPWRPIADQNIDLRNATREVIDIIFFLIGICEDLGISGNMLETKFFEILDHNYVRIKNGYSQDPKKGGDV